MQTDEEQMMETPRFVTEHFGAHAAPENDSPLKIVGVYADQPSHALAMGVLRNTARHCSGVCRFHSDWWSFDMLQAAVEREAAACAAAHADMIWCATNACEVLPASVTAWTDSWSTHRGESGCALVALLCCPAGYTVEQSPPRTFLCRLARAAGLEFFAQRFECDCHGPAQTPSPLVVVNDWFPVRTEPERGHIRWGINE